MNPVQVITRFEISGLLVENTRMAVVCQQVWMENQSRTCQIRKVMPNFGFSMGSKPALPMVLETLATILSQPAWWTAYIDTTIVATDSRTYWMKSVMTTATIPPTTV